MKIFSFCLFLGFMSLPLSCSSGRRRTLSGLDVKSVKMGGLITPEAIEAANKKQKYKIKKIIVLPINNQSFDVTAPILMQYLLEKSVKGRNYEIAMPLRKLDPVLRQVGIVNGNQINDDNMRQMGQLAKADAILHGSILLYRHDVMRKKTVIETNFKLMETKTGRILWNKNVSLENEDPFKEPFRQTVTSEWSDREIRSMSKSKAAKHIRDLVDKAMDLLPSAKDVTRVVLER